ncbi:MAG: HAD family hydrolase [bacterium]
MTKAVLLDLGNVVLGIDFRRVFSAWATAANVPVQIFYDRWQVDSAYADHETGKISFNEYADQLAARFEVNLSHEQWRRGWNSLWTEPFHDVIALLPAIASRYELYAFTNTNDTHAQCWRSLYGPALAPFEHIFVSSEIGVRKPHVEAFHYVCSAAGSEAGQTLFLDDTLENVNGALDAGLKAHHVASQSAVVAHLQHLLEH